MLAGMECFPNEFREESDAYASQAPEPECYVMAPQRRCVWRGWQVGHHRWLAGDAALCVRSGAPLPVRGEGPAHGEIVT